MSLRVLEQVYGAVEWFGMEENEEKWRNHQLLKTVQKSNFDPGRFDRRVWDPRTTKWAEIFQNEIRLPQNSNYYGHAQFGIV